MQSMTMQKSNEKIHLEDVLAMVFLLILVCCVAHTAKYLTYLLKIRYVLKFDNLRMTQCAKIIVGFMANVGNVFIKPSQTFFHVFYDF